MQKTYTRTKRIDKDKIMEMKAMREPSESEEKKGFVWTEEAIKDVETFIEHLVDKYLTYKRNEAEADQKYLEAASRHNRNMVIILVVFMIAIVLGMSYLTLNGKVSGDALLFLVGTITGYVLLFIQRLLMGTKEAPEQEET
jgi:heme/copper-type cytochrome/quinol oxidase subunit 2